MFVWSKKHQVEYTDYPAEDEQRSRRSLQPQDTARQPTGTLRESENDPYFPALEGFNPDSILEPGNVSVFPTLEFDDDAGWEQFAQPEMSLQFCPFSEAMNDLSAQYRPSSDQRDTVETVTLHEPCLNTRILPLRRSKSPITRSLINYDSVLVEYYFYKVATLYSCFDGDLNPFRTTISQIWSSSEVMKLTLQSLAAACLAKDIPHLAQQGVVLRKRALFEAKSQIEGNQASVVVLLCLIMLGQTASWHQPSDLGLSQYWDAKELFESLVSQETVGTTFRDGGLDLVFLKQAMSYWSMVLSFVSDATRKDLLQRNCDQMSCLRMHIIPHPWALVAPDLMTTISEVGHLIYSHRKACLQRKFWQYAHMSAIQDNISQSRELESTLFHHELPCEAAIVDPGDESTPVTHFIAVARAYQLFALLQVYRVFPDILEVRKASPGHLQLDIPLFLLDKFRPVPDADRETFLQRFALNIIKILAGIPFESHTRSIQAFLYVTLSSELRMPAAEAFQMSDLEVVEARRLIHSRLEAYRYVFAPQPAQRKLELVLKVWELMDHSSSVYWMDVMIENSMEVVFC